MNKEELKKQIEKNKENSKNNMLITNDAKRLDEKIIKRLEGLNPAKKVEESIECLNKEFKKMDNLNLYELKLQCNKDDLFLYIAYLIGKIKGNNEKEV